MRARSTWSCSRHPKASGAGRGGISWMVPVSARTRRSVSSPWSRSSRRMCSFWRRHRAPGAVTWTRWSVRSIAGIASICGITSACSSSATRCYAHFVPTCGRGRLCRLRPSPIQRSLRSGTASSSGWRRRSRSAGLKRCGSSWRRSVRRRPDSVAPTRCPWPTRPRSRATRSMSGRRRTARCWHRSASASSGRERRSSVRTVRISPSALSEGRCPRSHHAASSGARCWHSSSRRQPGSATASGSCRSSSWTTS